MHQKRLRGYKKLDYKVKSNFDVDSCADVLFDENDYFDAFAKDIERASNSIVISSPSMTKGGVGKMMEVITAAIMNGICILIITKSIDDYSIKVRPSVIKMHEAIKSSGIDLLIKQNVYQKYACVDNYIVWFGSVNVLGYNNGESMMRIQDKEVARELMDSI